MNKPKKLRVFSPHSDDAALSLAMTLLAFVDQGIDVEIVTCFSATNWAPFLEPGSPAHVVSKRRAAEDAAFADLLGRGTRAVGLGLADSPLRADWRMADGVVLPGDKAVIDQCRAELRERIRSLPHGDHAIAVPLALDHRDHMITRTAALAEAGTAPVMIYEDVPYALFQDAGNVEDFARQSLSQLNLAPRLLHRADYAFWRRAAACYETQLAPPAIASIGRLLEARGGERVWLTGRFRAWLR